MTPTVAKIVTFSAGGKEYRLRFNNRAWHALGIDPYKSDSKDFQSFISQLDMNKVQRFVWAGLLWENKTLKYEDIEEELMDNLDPPSWVELMRSLNATVTAKGEEPVAAPEPESAPESAPGSPPN
jgi:hypothetical protein